MTCLSLPCEGGTNQRAAATSFRPDTAATCQTARMDLRSAAVAARNNAEWCDLVCRTHGIDTELDADAWVARRRSPPLYPDAVILRDRVSSGGLLARVDSSPGCSVKDSMASVDLSAHGFGLLFEAEWIHRSPVGGHPARGLGWNVVRTSGELRSFALAHGGGEVFHPALLDNPDVAIFVAHDGDDPVAGLIGNASESVVGVSNLFVLAADPNQVWAEATAVVEARFPGLPQVGYEAGEGLRAAHHAGFISTGALRVWRNG
jgi:hypothetical protein